MKMKMKTTKLKLNESNKTEPKLALEVEPTVADDHILTLKLDLSDKWWPLGQVNLKAIKNSEYALKKKILCDF